MAACTPTLIDTAVYTSIRFLTVESTASLRVFEWFRLPFAEPGGNSLLKYAKALGPILSIIIGMSAYASLGYAQTAIVQAHNDYRNYTLRRHNDIQGVEAIYDDYRRAG